MGRLPVAANESGEYADLALRGVRITVVRDTARQRVRSEPYRLPIPIRLNIRKGQDARCVANISEFGANHNSPDGLSGGHSEDGQVAFGSPTRNNGTPPG